MESNEPTMNARSARSVAVAGVVAAGAGYLALWIVARRVSVADNSLFLAFWSTLFVVIGVESGLQHESTRAARSASVTGSTPPPQLGARILPTALAMGGGVAALVALTSPLWAVRLFPTTNVTTVIVLVVTALVYAGHAATVGTLAGMGQWSTYSALVGAESILRLVFVAVVVAVTTEVIPLQVAAAASAIAWLGFLATRKLRPMWRVQSDVPAARQSRKFISAMVAGGATAVLVVGFPVLLAATTDHEEYLTAAPLLLAVMMTRAPLLLPLGAFQGAIIAHFVQHQHKATRLLVQILLVLLGVALAGGALAWLTGPWLMVVLFGPSYVVSGWVLAGLVAAACLIALITITGAVCLALDRHGLYVTGWVVAAVITTALLLVSAGIEVRTITSLTAGPTFGAIWHLFGIMRDRSRLRSSARPHR